jgi:hypothetical protein
VLVIRELPLELGFRALPLELVLRELPLAARRGWPPPSAGVSSMRVSPQGVGVEQCGHEGALSGTSRPQAGQAGMG